MIEILLIINPREQRPESIPLIILYRVLIVDSIHKYKTASSFVVIALEPVLYEIHYLCSGLILCPLEIDADTKTSNQDTRICPSLLAIGYTGVQFSTRIILQMRGLYTGICKCNHSHNLCHIIPEHSAISLAHEFFLIGNRIIGEEIIKIIIATGERLTMREHLFGDPCQLTFLVKYECVFHHSSPMGT